MKLIFKMAIFAGNLSSRVGLYYQDRAFTIPWMKMNNAVMCVKGRDYGSSVPIRFIPKNCTKNIKLEKSLPLMGLDENENNYCQDSKSIQDGRGNWESGSSEGSHYNNRMTDGNSMFDGELAFGALDNDIMGELEEYVEEFETIQGLDYCGHDVLQASENKLNAEKIAIGLLAKRAYTVVQLRKKLHAKKFSSDIVEAVLSDFQSRGLINDSLYAETYSRSRWSTSSWGPRRIKQALFQKGVSQVDTEKALKVVFEDSESDGDEASGHGISKLSMDHLYVQASKQWLRGSALPNETRKARLIRWLQYRGFNWGVISSILKKLES